MQHLSLSIRPSRTEVLPDESLDVDVILTNGNSAAIFDVSNSNAPCPFQFVLRRIDGRQGMVQVIQVKRIKCRLIKPLDNAA